MGEYHDLQGEQVKVDDGDNSNNFNNHEDVNNGTTTTVPIIVDGSSTGDEKVVNDDGIDKVKTLSDEIPQGWFQRKVQLLWESLTLLYRLPSSLVYEIDNIVRNILSWIGIRSCRIIRYIAICGRCIFLVLYYSVMFIFPALLILFGTVIWLTWSTVILFYLLYDYYIPRNHLVEIPISFYEQPFLARELWMLGDTCHGLLGSAHDSIRYIPQPLPFMSVPIPGSFSDLEVECGLSRTLVYERTRLVGGLPMARCGESCSLEGMLDWQIKRSDEEAAMSFLPRQLFYSVFRGQPVDIGIDLRYDPYSIEDRSILPFEWRVKLHTKDQRVLQRVVRSRVYKSSVLTRIVRSIIVLIPDIYMWSRHDLYSLFSSHQKVFVFLNIESDARNERLCIDDVDYLTVELPVDIDLTSLKVVVKPRLTGKAWYLSSFPLSIFLISWCLVLLFCTTPLFVLTFSIYVVIISRVIPSALIYKTDAATKQDKSSKSTRNNVYERNDSIQSKDVNRVNEGSPQSPQEMYSPQRTSISTIKLETVIEGDGSGVESGVEVEKNGLLRRRKDDEPPSRTEKALKASGLWRPPPYLKMI